MASVLMRYPTWWNAKALPAKICLKLTKFLNSCAADSIHSIVASSCLRKPTSGHPTSGPTLATETSATSHFISRLCLACSWPYVWKTASPSSRFWKRRLRFPKPANGHFSPQPRRVNTRDGDGPGAGLSLRRVCQRPNYAGERGNTQTSRSLDGKRPAPDRAAERIAAFAAGQPHYLLRRRDWNG